MEYQILPASEAKALSEQTMKEKHENAISYAKEALRTNILNATDVGRFSINLRNTDLYFYKNCCPNSISWFNNQILPIIYDELIALDYTYTTSNIPQKDEDFFFITISWGEEEPIPSV